MFDESRVGPEPTPGEHAALCKIAHDRYENEVPPGYMDKKKKAPECFGDFVAWRQLLDYARAQTRSVILVIDDAKDDWWLMRNERTLGPRPELVKEFETECAGQRFHMYQSDRFMFFAKRYLRERITSAAIEEIQSQRAARGPGAGLKPKVNEARIASESSGIKSTTPRITSESGSIKAAAPEELKKTSAGPEEAE